MRGLELKTLLKKIDLQKLSLIFAIVVIATVASVLNTKFITSKNISSIFQQIAVLGILTMPQAMLVIMGSNDLSYGGIMGLVGATIWLLSNNGASLFVIILAALMVGLTCGVINGFIVSYSKCIALIITLGMQYVYYGITLAISGGSMMTANGTMAFMKGITLFGLPLLIYIFIIVVVIYLILHNYTRFGRRIVAIGGNDENAFLSGISVNFYKIVNYALSGITVAVAMMVLLGRTDAMTASVGDGYALRSLSAAVIGGVSFTGGKGSIIGAFLGCALMGVLSNAMNVVGISGYYQTTVEGIIIVLAVTLSNLENIRKK